MKKSSVACPFEVLPLSKKEGGGYSIYFPDLPGCWSEGATPEDTSRTDVTRCSHGWPLRKSLELGFPDRSPRSAGVSCKVCRVRFTRD